MSTITAPAREVFVRRRLFVIFLPLIVVGMLTYMWASLQTLTLNGLGVAGFILAGAAAVAAAWDAGDRP